MNITNQFLLISAIIFIGIVVARIRSRKTYKILTNQAQKRTGKITGNGFFGHMEMQLPMQDKTVVIRLGPGSGNTPPRTSAQVRIEDSIIPKMRITHNNFWSELEDKWKNNRILTNNEEFDNKFFITGEDSHRISRLLTDDLKTKTLDPFFDSMDIWFESDELCIMVGFIPKNEEEFDIFLDTVELFLRNFLHQR